MLVLIYDFVGSLLGPKIIDQDMLRHNISGSLISESF